MSGNLQVRNVPGGPVPPVPAVINLNVVHSDLKQLLSIFNKPYDIKSFLEILNQLETCQRPSLVSWKSRFTVAFFQRLRNRFPPTCSLDKKYCTRLRVCIFQQVVEIHDELHNKMRAGVISDSESEFLIALTDFFSGEVFIIEVDQNEFLKENRMIAKEAFASGLQKMFQGLGDMISSLRLGDDESGEESIVLQLQSLSAQALNVTAGIRTSRMGTLGSSSSDRVTN